MVLCQSACSQHHLGIFFCILVEFSNRFPHKVQDRIKHIFDTCVCLYNIATRQLLSFFFYFCLERASLNLYYNVHSYHVYFIGLCFHLPVPFYTFYRSDILFSLLWVVSGQYWPQNTYFRASLPHGQSQFFS